MTYKNYEDLAADLNNKDLNDILVDINSDFEGKNISEVIDLLISSDNYEDLERILAFQEKYQEDGLDFDEDIQNLREEYNEKINQITEEEEEARRNREKAANDYKDFSDEIEKDDQIDEESTANMLVQTKNELAVLERKEKLLNGNLSRQSAKKKEELLKKIESLEKDANHYKDLKEEAYCLAQDYSNQIKEIIEKKKNIIEELRIEEEKIKEQKRNVMEKFNKLVYLSEVVISKIAADKIESDTAFEEIREQLNKAINDSNMEEIVRLSQKSIEVINKKKDVDAKLNKIEKIFSIDLTNLLETGKVQSNVLKNNNDKQPTKDIEKTDDSQDSIYEKAKLNGEAEGKKRAEEVLAELGSANENLKKILTVEPKNGDNYGEIYEYFYNKAWNEYIENALALQNNVSVADESQIEEETKSEQVEPQQDFNKFGASEEDEPSKETNDSFGLQSDLNSFGVSEEDESLNEESEPELEPVAQPVFNPFDLTGENESNKEDIAEPFNPFLNPITDNSVDELEENQEQVSENKGGILGGLNSVNDTENSSSDDDEEQWIDDDDEIVIESSETGKKLESFPINEEEKSKSDNVEEIKSEPQVQLELNEIPLESQQKESFENEPKTEILSLDNRTRAIVDYLQIANPKLAEDLLNEYGYWANEQKPGALSDWVNSNIKKSAEDEMSVTIYSLLMGVNQNEVKEKFIEDGFTNNKSVEPLVNHSSEEENQFKDEEDLMGSDEQEETKSEKKGFFGLFGKKNKEESAHKIKNVSDAPEGTLDTLNDNFHRFIHDDEGYETWKNSKTEKSRGK